MTIPASELAAWSELAAKATPGPWKSELDILDSDGTIEANVIDGNVDMLVRIATDLEVNSCVGQEAVDAAWDKAAASQELRDARYIVAACNNLPRLLSAYSQSQARVAELEAEKDALRGGVFSLLAGIVREMHGDDDKRSLKNAMREILRLVNQFRRDHLDGKGRTEIGRRPRPTSVLPQSEGAT